MSNEMKPYAGERLESLRRMSSEEKKEYLAQMLEEGRRQADMLLGWHGEPTMTREEIMEMIATKYPGLSLSDQIIKDRKSGF